MTADQFNILWQVAAVVFAAGVVWAKLEAIQKDIARLEEKQDKYNHLQERVVKIEAHIEEAKKV